MHVLQPKHSKLSVQDTKLLLEKYNISKVQLPKMNHIDAAIISLNVKAGDVIKIERKSSKTPYYRIVV